MSAEKKTRTAKKSAEQAGNGAQEKKPAAGRRSRKKEAAGQEESQPVRLAGVVASATLKHIRISPRKARLAVNLIKGQQVESALRLLKFNPGKGARLAEGVLRSAITNAKERAGVDVDNLWVLGGKVDMGKTLKRYMSAAHGRAAPIRKRSAHITLYVGETK